MADSPLTQIRGKKFRQREIDLDQFTDEELCSRYRSLEVVLEDFYHIFYWPRVNKIYGRNPQEPLRETDDEKTGISCCQCGYYVM